MPGPVTIDRPDVVALIDTAARSKTGGNRTEAVALAMRRLLDIPPQKGAFPVRRDVFLAVDAMGDPTAPTFDEAVLAGFEESMMRPFLDPGPDPGGDNADDRSR